MDFCLMHSLPFSLANRFPLNNELNPIGRLCFLCIINQNKLVAGGRRSLIIACSNKRRKKPDTHHFLPKPDEITGPFPEAVLLKKKVLKEDGSFAPEFANAEEEKLYESLKLEFESDVQFERIQHYEVLYLIHEAHVEKVDDVVSKVKDFITEKKGRIWRLNDWGLRRLCYKIKRARKANYILMNFEIEARWVNAFKSMLDKEEHIIRHLVIKRDKAITEDCPPPPEFHTLVPSHRIYNDVDVDDLNQLGDEEEDNDGNDVDVEEYDGNVFDDKVDDGNDVEDREASSST